MENIKVLGKQIFMGKEIPVLEGAFGEHCKVVTDKMISEIHSMRNADVRRRISDNIIRFKDGIDYIDLKNCCASDAQLNLSDYGYTNMAISKADNIYLLSERGYAKLIKIMDTDLAWEIHDELVSQYFTMRETIKEMANMLTEEEILSLAIFKAETREKALVAASELDRYRKKQLELANNKIEEQRPLVEVSLRRRTSDNLITIKDVTDIYCLKQGQTTCWAKANGYIHKTNKEVNAKGKEYFRVYGEEYPNIGITEKGMILIDKHIDEIKKMPTSYKAYEKMIKSKSEEN